MILLALSAFFSGSETAVFALDRLEARTLAKQGRGALGQIYRRINLFLTTVLFLNLLTNARDALRGRPGARILLEIRSEGEGVELVVHDNGPGVPDEVHERIFDPFFTTKGPDAGMGLGLALAFDIARDHGGVLEERSDGASGARFVLRLPVATGPGALRLPVAGDALGESAAVGSRTN